MTDISVLLKTFRLVTFPVAIVVEVCLSYVLVAVKPKAKLQRVIFQFRLANCKFSIVLIYVLVRFILFWSFTESDFYLSFLSFSQSLQPR